MPNSQKTYCFTLIFLQGKVFTLLVKRSCKILAYIITFLLQFFALQII